LVVATWRSARSSINDLTEAQVRTTLARFDELWDELFPAEQARIVKLLVDRVRIAADGINITLHNNGAVQLLSDLSPYQQVAA
jgi:hypothetical protein